MRVRRVWPRIAAAQPYWRATRRAAAQMSARASPCSRSRRRRRRSAALDGVVERRADEQHAAGRRRIELAQGASTSRPSRSGMRRSSRTTSGRSAPMASSAASPPSASPTSSRPAYPHRAPHPAPEHGAVVDDQDADGARAAGYLRADSVDPPSGRASQSIARPRLPPRRRRSAASSPPSGRCGRSRAGPRSRRHAAPSQVRAGGAPLNLTPPARRGGSCPGGPAQSPDRREDRMSAPHPIG